ncbi:hypothetical protein [Nocardiopsis halotolerans]|uniref:hypothetical protein n=1 Tax=Nocardiopsis halotolerans TaxID=124252 RepID=UPI000364B5D2|nr:hypothetical protein [Nocardiopsis halotolerans]
MTKTGYTPKGADTGRPHDIRWTWTDYVTTNAATKYGFDGDAMGMLFVVCASANPDGTSAALSAEQIAERTRQKDRKRVGEVLNYAREAGLLTRVFEPKGGRGNKLAPVYWLTFPWEPHKKIAFEASKLLGVDYVKPPEKVDAEILREEQHLPRTARAKARKERHAAAKANEETTPPRGEGFAPEVVRLKPKPKPKMQRKAKAAPAAQGAPDVAMVQGHRVTREQYERWQELAASGLPAAADKVEELRKHFEAAA